MEAAELAGLVGRALPSGTYRIEPRSAALLRHSVHAEPDPAPHPIYAFVGGQSGLGITVAELLALFGAQAEEGPLLGECAIELLGEFRTDVEYRVTGTIVDAQRKSGRRIGTFDLVSFVVELTDPDGHPVSRCRETFVLPRKGEACGE